MGFVEPALGEKMHSFGVVLVGKLTDQNWIAFLHEVAKAIGMTAVADPAVWTYPTADGKGGNGQTVVLPITESFLALDTWADHEGAYLFVCSCRSFFSVDIEAVAKTFALKVSLQPGKRFYHELNLK